MSTDLRPQESSQVVQSEFALNAEIFLTQLLWILKKKKNYFLVCSFRLLSYYTVILLYRNLPSESCKSFIKNNKHIYEISIYPEPHKKPVNMLGRKSEMQGIILIKDTHYLLRYHKRNTMFLILFICFLASIIYCLGKKCQCQYNTYIPIYNNNKSLFFLKP